MRCPTLLSIPRISGVFLRVTVFCILVKSGIGSTQKIRATLTGLGLTKMQKTVTRKNTPEIRGMLNKVGHLIRVEEI
ncbi:MAG: 50S ribosomal protein L30 [Proteobacteria bacterium]|nr:50S ribosomal protein L30 [Pseudomonadota bacterium]